VIFNKSISDDFEKLVKNESLDDQGLVKDKINILSFLYNFYNLLTLYDIQ
jgi:hypothetical protein